MTVGDKTFDPTPQSLLSYLGRCYSIVDAGKRQIGGKAKTTEA